MYQCSSPLCSIHPSVYAHQDELLYIRERGGGREGEGEGDGGGGGGWWREGRREGGGGGRERD